MSRPGVTYTEVSQAAQQLIASGRTPTVEGIRLILGTGSNSTLGQHLRSWKTKQDVTQHIATKEKIPEELVSALKGVWERVVNQSELTIQTIQQESQQALLTAKQEIQQLQQSYHECQQRSYQAQQERDSLTHDKSTLEHLLSTAKMDLAILTEKLAGLDHHQHEKQQRIDELHRQNQQIHANLEHYREASLAQRLEDQQRYEQQQHQLEQQLRQRDQELHFLKEEKVMLLHSQQHAVFEKESVQTQLVKLETQCQSQATHLTDTISELAKKSQEAEHWQSQYHDLKGNYEDEVKGKIEIQTQHAVLTQQVSQLQQELQDLRHQNSALAHEKWILGQENAQLLGQIKQLQPKK